MVVISRTSSPGSISVRPKGPGAYWMAWGRVILNTGRGQFWPIAQVVYRTSIIFRLIILCPVCNRYR